VFAKCRDVNSDKQIIKKKNPGHKALGNPFSKGEEKRE
jgi:hypothetical protein